MKPVVGVVADQVSGKHRLHSTQEKYLDAVAGGAGALPILLPALIDRPGGAFRDAADFDQVLDMIDGLFLTGAVSNVMPERYGRTLQDANSPADPARDHVSLRLAAECRARGIPVFGVCRGFQEINVALGGTLHQAVHHVPGMNDHRENREQTLAEQYGPAHEVSFTPGGALETFTGATGARVNSLHGQGVDQLAPGLVVEAIAPDGLIEAYRTADDTHFLLAVQWHPEWRFRDDAISVAIFRAFGNAARAYARSRGRAV